MSATIDHVIPVAKRGFHTLNNLAAAHLICNLRKGDK
jgi:5-methylcytosine-specific restriction endonuclease McrA